MVIVDLVNDQPHWRVRMFDPSADDGMKRLLNVAFTRAQRRLVVVGNFPYIEKIGKKAFLGRFCVPLLRQWSAPISAKDVVAAEVIDRAAAAQMNVTGGATPAGEERVVVTQEHFDQFFVADLRNAKSRVVVFSPFLTSNRLEQVGLQLQAAVVRGARVYVVTKSLSDRGMSEKRAYREVEAMLAARGITVIHKKGMHEKLVFVDSDILWSGSLNPLSFRNTQEVMERRKSAAIVEDYATAIKLDELLAAYESGDPTCPYCHSEVIAAEGRSGVYWQCSATECTYARDVGAAAAVIVDGLLKCRRCLGDLDFEEFRDKPYWRCKSNTRHRQRIELLHLSLKRMKCLVPEKWQKHFTERLNQKQKGRSGSSQTKLWQDGDDSDANPSSGAQAESDVPVISETHSDCTHEPFRATRNGACAANVSGPNQPAIESMVVPATGEIWRMTQAEFHTCKRSNTGPYAYDPGAINKEYWAAIKEAIECGKSEEIPAVTMKTFRLLRAHGTL